MAWSFTLIAHVYPSNQQPMLLFSQFAFRSVKAATWSCMALQGPDAALAEVVRLARRAIVWEQLRCHLQVSEVLEQTF